MSIYEYKKLTVIVKYIKILYAQIEHHLNSISLYLNNVSKYKSE